MIVGTAALLAVTAVLALALGALFRRSAAAVITAIALVLLPQVLATASVIPSSAAQWLLRVTPAAGFAIQQSIPAYPQVEDRYIPALGYYPLPPLGEFAVMCAYAAVAADLRGRDAAQEGRVKTDPGTSTARTGTTRSLRAEWTKFRTLPGLPWLVLLLVALTVGTGAVAAALLPCCDVLPSRVSLAGVQTGQIAAVALAVGVMAGEYGSGMIVVSLLAVPARGRLLAAKALLVGGCHAGRGAGRDLPVGARRARGHADCFLRFDRLSRAGVAVRARRGRRGPGHGGRDGGRAGDPVRVPAGHPDDSGPRLAGAAGLALADGGGAGRPGRAAADRPVGRAGGCSPDGPRGRSWWAG